MGIFSKRGSKRKTVTKNSGGTNKASKSSNDKNKRRSSRPKKEPKGSLTQTKSRSNAPSPNKERKKRTKSPEAIFKDSQVLPANMPLAKPQKIEVKNRTADESTVTRVFEKYKRGEKERSQAQKSINEMDEKAKILIDRVTKKPSILKFKPGEKSELLIDDLSFFHKAPRKDKKRVEESMCFEDDSYSQVPRLVNVRKMAPDNIYIASGVPFWAEYLEPKEEDLKDTEDPISIASEHLEMYHNKTLKLHSVEPTNLVLNDFQPLSDLMKRDEVYFDYRFVFSNTIRSLINILDRDDSKMEIRKSYEKVEKRQIKFDAGVPPIVWYSRDNPIESIRSLRQRTTPPTVSTTTGTTSTSSLEEAH